MKNVLLLLAGVLVFCGVLTSSTASAAVTGFEAGRIIDDGVFTNKNMMNVDQIQQFLNAKMPNCDTYGQKMYNGSMTRAQYGASRGISTPFTCLRDYSANGKSSAQMIYDTAQKYTINPQVLIVLLQKEQALVTDDWPFPVQYRSATGYGCPDTAACDSQYYGLENQLDWAAKMFRAIMNNSPTWYTPYVLGNNYIRYNPVASCGGTNVLIQNRATQALYNYTPYQPNASALATEYGSGDSCGAYGNRNFYVYFKDWFGSPTTAPTYTWDWAGQQVQYGSNPVVESNSVTIQPGGTAKLIVKARNTSNQTWYRFNTTLGTSRPNDRQSELKDSSWLSDNRAARMKEDMIGQGGLATFEFTITAPNKIFASREYFNIAIEGVNWLSDIGYYYDVNVTPPAGEYYNTNLSSPGLYTNSARTSSIGETCNTVTTNSMLYGRITAKNTGNNDLTPGQAYLATTAPRDRTSSFQDSSWLSSNRVATVSSSVASGASTVVPYQLKAPNTPGRYSESFGFVVEGKGWIDYDKTTYPLTVINQPRIELYSNGTVVKNQEIMSSGYKYSLIMQSDGNLVLYKCGSPIWSTGTVGASDPTLVMQNDGNLVIYASGGRPVWSSNTVSGQNSVLKLQNDGNMVMYGAGNTPRWSTGTSNR